MLTRTRDPEPFSTLDPGWENRIRDKKKTTPDKQHLTVDTTYVCTAQCQFIINHIYYP
jgi:hypothetical protein